MKADIASLKAQKDKLQEGRVETEERKRKYQRYLELKEQEAQQEQELKMFSENDPEELARLEKLVEVIMALGESQGRWWSLMETGGGW